MGLKVENMIGYKIFKQDKDDLKIYRIIDVKKRAEESENTSVKIKDLDNNEEIMVKLKDLEGYTPLEPDAYLTFNVVYIDDGGKRLHDVIITGSKLLNLKVGDMTPYVVCRQSITDIFYNMIAKSEEDMIVGLSINQDDCPTNFDFRNFLACDGVEETQHINYYRTDTVESVLSMIKINNINNILENNFKDHIKASKNAAAAFKKEDRGWCKDLVTLLRENNFQSDIDQMLGITSVDFKMEDCIVKKILPGTEDKEYNSITNDLKLWLSQLHRVNINSINVIEFGYDIDLVDFKNSRYFLIRDNTNKLYLLVYTINKEEFEFDLINKAKELDVESKYLLNFYNKYSKYNNNQK